MTTPKELAAFLAAPEGVQLEFKEARNRYDFEDLLRYCVALANEGGGKIILGVTDKRPRRVIGTNAFPEPGRVEAGIFDELHYRVVLEECRLEDNRVLIVHVPPREVGRAWHYRGAYWMRAGDALVPMSDDVLRQIHEENAPDFSAQICAEASNGDLDPTAIAFLRDLWSRVSPGQRIDARSLDALLADTELAVAGRLTYAALILLGTREALGRHLAQAEIVFEYRSTGVPGPAADRVEFRQGFLPVLDQVWQRINLRNDLQHFQHRLVMWPVPTFNERAIREAILNAASHRDYRHGGSIFVRQFPRRIEITSPGGFPAGVTPENVIWVQNPRNRRIADVLAKCGLVERAGQGFDLIYRECIRQGKPLPDFTHTDAHMVWVTLHGTIQDSDFLRFLEEIGQEVTASFDTEDFLAIDLVHREQPIPERLKARIGPLLESGVIERLGRGRGVRYLLSQRFYRFLGQPGVYTRKRGLDRETNKALLLKHVRDSQVHGAIFAECAQVLPSLSRRQVQGLLIELRAEGQVQLRGVKKGARWFPSD